MVTEILSTSMETASNDDMDDTISSHPSMLEDTMTSDATGHAPPLMTTQGSYIQLNCSYI